MECEMNARNFSINEMTDVYERMKRGGGGGGGGGVVELSQPFDQIHTFQDFKYCNLYTKF